MDRAIRAQGIVDGIKLAIREVEYPATLPIGESEGGDPIY